jgi:hypothetical protein
VLVRKEVLTIATTDDVLPYSALADSPVCVFVCLQTSACDDQAIKAI